MAETERSHFNDEADAGFGFEFSERSIRMGFIRKVYAILMCQILVTMAIMSVFMFVAPVQAFCAANPWTWILALVMTFVLMITLACCTNVRRTYPLNVILLGLFTLCEGYLLGAIASSYDVTAVLIAVGMTAAVALALTLFAFQTKYDFTTCSGFVLVTMVILILFGILCIFIQSQILQLVYASIGALLFSFYLVFDTQMMLGGKHKYALSPEEYVFAALNLYLDVVNLFLFILMLVGGSNR